MKVQAKNGFALLGFTILIAMIGALALYREWYCIKVLQHRSDFTHAARAQYQAQESALLGGTSPSPNRTAPLSCSELTAQSADIRITRRLCAIHDLGARHISERAIIEGSALTQPHRFPQFNYNEIFRDFTHCAESFVRSTTKSPLGFELSPLSSISKQICFAKPEFSSPKVVYKGNVVLAEDATAAENTKLVAAAGYIDFSGTLSVSADTLIVAGGDVHLSKLSSSLALAHVTVLSATGIVMIDEVSGPLELRAIGWQGVFVPGNATLVSHDFVPPALRDQVLSLTPAMPE